MSEAHTFDFITGEGKSQNKGNKYGATRSAGDYRRKVQLARLCAWGVEDMVVEPALGEEIVGS